MDRRPGAVPVLVLLVLSILVGSCTGGGQGSGGGPGARSTSAAVQELGSIATLHDAFNKDAGKVRLVLLISPT
jgi:hypothetical protein